MRAEPATVRAQSNPLLLAGLIALAVCAGLAVVRPAMVIPLNIYDEGIILVGASRVMRGELPYRDFWTVYSPGQFYTLAGLFAVTGKSVLAARYWDGLTRALIAVALAGLAARAGGHRAALFVWPVALLWLVFYGFFSYPLFQGLLFSALSLLAFLLALERAERGRPAARLMAGAGLLFGLAFVYRHDMALYLGAALVITLAAHIVLAHSGQRTGQYVRTDMESPAGAMPLREIGPLCAPLVGAAALIIVPLTLYFVALVSPSSLLNQLFIFPLLEFPKWRDLPYPKLTGELSNLPFYAPFLIYCVSAVIAIARLRGPMEGRGRGRAMLALTAFGLFGYNQARVRSDQIHTVHFFLLALTLLGAWLPARLSVDSASPRTARLAASMLGLFAMTLLLALLIEPIEWYGGRLKQSTDPGTLARIAAAPPNARGIPVDEYQGDMLTALKFYAKPEDGVYIGLKHNDKVFANDVVSYFVIDRPVPTRYHEIHPGVGNTLPVQQEMIAEFERARPRILFLTGMFDGADEPNASAHSTGIVLFDDYVRAHYRMFTSSGPFMVYKRKEGL